MRCIFFCLVFPFSIFSPALTEQINQIACCNTIAIIWPYIVVALVLFILKLFLSYCQIDC